MSTQETLLTADEFYEFLLSRTTDAMNWCDGEVIESSPANDQHGEIAG